MRAGKNTNRDNAIAALDRTSVALGDAGNGGSWCGDSHRNSGVVGHRRRGGDRKDSKGEHCPEECECIAGKHVQYCKTSSSTGANPQ